MVARRFFRGAIDYSLQLIRHIADVADCESSEHSQLLIAHLFTCELLNAPTNRRTDHTTVSIQSSLTTHLLMGLGARSAVFVTLGTPEKTRR
jgi:hypothetical protein